MSPLMARRASNELMSGSGSNIIIQPARAVSVLQSHHGGGSAGLNSSKLAGTASNVQTKKQLAGPDFSERQAKVVSKYSYSLPQKSALSQISNSSQAKKHVGTSLLQENQKNYIKSLRKDADVFDMEVAMTGNQMMQQSSFMNKVQEGLHLHSFGNDRTGFYSRMEHENEAFVNAKAYDGNINIRSTNNVYPKMKTVVARQGNTLNNASLAGQLRRRNGAKSSIVGPTIKNNSRLASYFPNI